MRTDPNRDALPNRYQTTDADATQPTKGQQASCSKQETLLCTVHGATAYRPQPMLASSRSGTRSKWGLPGVRRLVAWV